MCRDTEPLTQILRRKREGRRRKKGGGRKEEGRKEEGRKEEEGGWRGGDRQLSELIFVLG